jgi:hypothetical protein
MFVTIQELARFTGIHERMLRRAAQYGTLAVRRIGRRRLYVHVDEAERFAGRSIVKTADTTDRTDTTDKTLSTAA